MKTLTSEVGDTLVLASILSSRLQDFLSPLLIELDQVLDRRLVKTFAATLSLLLEQRYRATGLLLSELGAFLGGFSHAPAGTKRLSNLLRSPRWSSAVLEDFLWKRAEAHLRDMLCRGRDALLLWDESVWEKPESTAPEGLGSVRSAQAARRKRIKPGFYTPPGPPVFVPGLQWLSLLLLGRSGPPVLAKMRGWTPRGERAYARRWQIERSFRFTKSELALQSPRLWFWENRLKLLQRVSLAYAFLLGLLQPELHALRAALLRGFCPRTGKRSRDVSTPLYRLRAAICFLWMSLRTPLLPQIQSSG
jgi:hypothetical protein